MSEHPAAKRHRAYAQAVDEAFAQRGYLDGHKDGVLDERARIRKAVEGDILRALMEDHGCLHHNGPGAGACRTCKRRAQIVLAAIDALKGEQT